MQKTANCCGPDSVLPPCKHGWRRNLTKTLLVMRLTSFFILATVLQVSAGSSSGQTVTYSGTSESLEKVFQIVEKQTGYLFFYDHTLLESTAPVTVKAKNLPLESFLRELFIHQPLTYSIENRTIFVTPKMDVGITIMVTVDEPTQIVSGTLVHSETKIPLEGASVFVKSSRYLSMTDAEGHFSVPARTGDVLVISYVGFKSKDVKVTSPNLGTISLSPAEVVLNEVVINKGYYNVSKRLNTGSVSKVTSEDIERQPVTSPVLALQGRVPGLEITPSAGVPGSFVTLRVRGMNSLRYDANAPLYIIDGVPFDSRAIVGSSTSMTPQGFDPLSSLNPANIESIEVLKDADATAIYGSRGANGIILITTKQFAHGGKTSIDFSAYQGWGKVSRKTKLLNTQQYLAMRRESFKNDNAQPGNYYGDYDLTKWDSTRYTDWQKVLLGHTARILDAQGAVSGGTGGTTFRLEGSFHKESSVISDDFAFKRGTVSASAMHNSPSQKLQASVTVNYGFSSNEMIGYTNYGNLANIALTMAPNAPALYTKDGQLNWENNTFQNPLANLQNSLIQTQNTLMTNGSISYTLAPGLILRANLGYNELHSTDNGKYPLSAYNPFYRHYYTGSYLTVSEKRTGFNVEPTLNYSKTFGGSDLSVVVGATWQGNQSQSLGLNATGYSTDELIGNLRAAQNVYIERDQSSQYRYNAVFGRIGYTLKEKYLFNLTGRRDGSSRFGPDNRFASFGALGLGWIFSREHAVEKALPFLSFGKIRSSYGSTGNDAIGDYQFLSTYNIAYYQYANTVSFLPSGLSNPNFAWELTKKLEVALELGFLKDAINVEASWYHNRSSNQLVGTILPSTTGFQTVTANFPATVQNAGFELSVQTENIKNSHFKWTSSFNISFQRNKLISFKDLEQSPSYSYLQPGRPTNIQRLFRSLGVDPATGFYKLEDLDKDGFVTYENDARIIKDLNASYYGGLNNSFTFHGFELSFFIRFIKQPGIIYTASWPGNENNQPVEVLDRWQKPGDAAKFQKFTQDLSNQTFYDILNKYSSSTGVWTDASFARLQTMTMAYNFPEKLLSKVHIHDCKIYLQGQNLFTVTSYNSLDPETTTNIPPIRMITGGIQLKF